MRGAIRIAFAIIAAGAVLAGARPLPGAISLAATGGASTAPGLLDGGRPAPLLGDTESAQTPAAPARPPSRPSGNPLWAVPLRSLAATRERPLFSPSRRPPAAAVAAMPVVEAPPPPAPVVPERPALTLVGTIIGGSDKIAIFFNASSGAVIRLRLGEADNGWVLRSIGARETVLQKDDQSFTLALPSPEDAPTKGAPPQGAEEQL